MPPFEKIKALGLTDFCLLSCETFLKRKVNSFDSNIPLVIYGAAKRSGEVLTKLKEFTDFKFAADGELIIAEPVPFAERKTFSFGDLREIILRLRDADGCPWDRAQTNMTIRENAVEEAYELVEAVELGDNEKILEESGDVLLQGIFNAIIAESENRFTVNEMTSALCRKLIGRHTHIFGTDKAKNCGEALGFWEEAKAKEKKQKSVSDKIDSVPKTFGALQRTNKVQKILHKAGFDFPSAEDARIKIAEETQELFSALEKDREKEAGDLLFSVINVIRLLDIDPELALNRSTNVFIERFKYVERTAESQGKRVSDCTQEEMDIWYNEYKRLENR